MPNNINVSLKVNNIGPHSNLNYNSTLKNLNIGVYGRNGNGKTFISRCFRLFELTESERVKYITQMLKFGENNGNFTFKINNDYAQIKISNNQIEVENNTNKLFYVFNSDYVNDNLALRNYKPNGEIDGVILGKVEIDLTEEKNKRKELVQKGTELKSDFEKIIAENKNEIKKFGITSSMKLFQDITYENVMKLILQDDTYDEAVNKLQSINSVPDDLKSINKLVFDFDLELFDKIQNILTTKYNVAKFKDEFKNYIKNNLNFVEKGMKLYEENKGKCPFCGMELNEQAFNLLDDYSDYLQDQEAVIIKVINDHLIHIDSEIHSLNNMISMIEKTKSEISLYEHYFNKETEFNYNELIKKIRNLISNLDNISIMLNKKKSNVAYDINYSSNEPNLLISEIVQSFKTLEVIISDNNKLLINISKLKTEYKRELCKECMLKIRKENASLVNELLTIREEAIKVSNYIKKIEMGTTKSKKDLVANDLEKYIKIFFHDKYKFDKNKFYLSLSGTKLGDNTSFVLSDGEKSALAFAYYLANIHTIIKTTEDYNKIFFVIDDPVSSMDFHLMYEIIGVIKNLNSALDINHLKIILLTHSLEFFSTIIRNDFIKNSLVLEKGNLELMNKQLIMPYELHLKDIYNVTQGVHIVHTIPNSIRHVLETICHFEGLSKKKLKDFLEENEEFLNKDYLYVLFEDMSHGSVRFDIPYTEEEIKEACQAVVKFIERKYSSQLDLVK